MKAGGLVLAAVVATCAPASGAEDQNARHEVAGQHGAWTAYRVVDTFEDSVVQWYAMHPHGEDGSVRFECSRGAAPKFTAYADNMFIDALGQRFNRKPIRVRVRVDGNAVIDSKGRYPNDIAVELEAYLEILRQFLRGSEARIRTEHDDEQHTFVLALDGFLDAAQWVADECQGARQ